MSINRHIELTLSDVVYMDLLDITGGSKPTHY